MSLQTEIAQDAVFRSHFMDRQQSLQQQNSKIFNHYWQNSETIDTTQKGNEQVFISDVQLSVRGGYGSFEYPAGVTFDRDRFKAFPVEQVASYQIDAPTYDDYRSNKKEVVASLTNDLELLQKEFYKWQDIIMAGDGSGVVGQLGTGSTDTVLVLATTPGGVHGAGFGVDILKRNVLYDLYNGTTLVQGDIQISSIDYSANTVTLTAALSGGAPAAGLKLYPADSKGLFPKGLRYGVMGQKDFWQGSNCANRPEANSMVQDAGGELIGNLYIERLLQKQGFRVGDGMNQASEFWISPSLKSLYKATGWTLTRGQHGDQKFNTGAKEVGYEDSIFKPWRNLDPDVCVNAPVKNVKKIVQRKIGFYDYSGKMFQQSPGSGRRGAGELYAQFGGRYNWYYENPQDMTIAYNFDVSNAVTRSNYHSTT